MTIKRTHLLLVAVFAIALIMVPAMAFANAGVHGNFTMDTDQCAGCHRAHTAPSATTWTDQDNQQQSALLLGDYATLQEFCLTCHGVSAQGADTDVQSGVYRVAASQGAYGTPGAQLISGPFGYPAGFDGSGKAISNGVAPDGSTQRVTSSHDYFGASWGAYGGGSFAATAGTSPQWTGSLVPSVGVGAQLIKMDCGTCHDAHGTSNYRMLRDSVYGVTVGGYGAGPAFPPTPFVLSIEDGFPAGGFAKSTAYPAYKPDYTHPNYAQPPLEGATPDLHKGMSGWCVGCHTYYMGEAGVSDATTYTADSFFGKVVRHRHPVNRALSTFRGPTAVVAQQNSADPNFKGQLPLLHASTETSATKTNTNGDWIDCLTCHYAHGTTAVMSGYANVANPIDQVPGSGKGGVAPTDDSSLLRFDDRYVCQACHNK